MSLSVMRGFRKAVAFLARLYDLFVQPFDVFVRTVARLSPIRAIKRAVADGLGDVRRANRVRPVKVCNGTTNFQYPIKGAR